MTGEPTFALVELAQLKDHEEVDEAEVRALARKLQKEGRIRDPLWVARGSLVILNGHHRFRALTLLGARWAPAWMFDYEDPSVHLDRWGPGPPIPKSEVVRRGTEGRPFPPKTTKHTILHPLPDHPTELAELFDRPAGPRATPAAHSAARRAVGR
jgi:L-serine kinase (ADP)